MVRTALVVVQHGEKERAPGDPGLTARGREQAQITAATFAGRRPRPAALYASPLRRAVETAAPIGAALGLRAVVEPGLRERMNWEGPDVQSLEAFLTEWRLCSSDRDVVPTTGDSSNEAARRFLATIDGLVARHMGRVVVAVTHGGVTTDLLRTLLGDERAQELAPRLIADGVPPCALSRLSHDGARWRVESVASTAHLG